MTKAYLDANVIVRLITGDPPEMADRAERLFRRVDEGDLELVVETIVAAETVWVLSSFYGFSSADIAPVMSAFLVSKGIVCDEKVEILQALALYADRNIDFADALLAVKMIREGATQIYSFDDHFNRLESIHRLDPG